MRKWWMAGVLMGCVLGFSSCATVKGWVGRGEDKDAAPAAAAPAEAEAGAVETEDPETSLRKVVAREIAALDHTSAAAPDQLVRRRPFWLKEYVEYPENSDNLQVEVQETESRSRPYIADVKVPKVRYSTRLHRERNEAANDANFLRDTGEETLTYEYRSGRWVRVGSLFVADKTEEKVSGEWQPVQEEPKRVVTEEDQPGIFKRSWSWITGR
ncbi:MAG: hypothetical protein HYV26_06290 [Candidatus Hydrogenedentes bacterium]|nr:hypothetical protein [Candidatus Hydrogenedentota bacterium]MBI3118122.1 hypothetical protein [Candidatus Hydrogenedentota bacterium]